MHNFIGKKVLITTNGWFFGNDGKSYRAVHGTLKAIHECGKTLGFIPNRSHANWFVEVGEMVIMGCQVMYLIQSDTVETGNTSDYTTEGGAFKEFDRPTSVYIVS